MGAAGSGPKPGSTSRPGWRLYSSAAVLLLTGVWFWSLPEDAVLHGTPAASDCPLSYEQMAPSEVEAGRKPYLFGGMERPACRACGRQELWAQLCQFSMSHYYNTSSGRMWPTLAACSEDVQWGILKSWLGRGYQLPLTLTPCDMWRHLAGRTVFLAGDSIMQDFFKALHCFMFELWDSLEEEPLTADEALLEQLSFMPEPARPPTCAVLAGGASRICFFRLDNGSSIISGLLPFLKDSGAATPRDVLIANMGLHYGQEKTLAGLAHQFAVYVAEHRAQLPRVFWQQTSAQHFKTHTGEYPGGKEPFECAPLAGGILEVKGDGELVLKPGQKDSWGLMQGSWRNRACVPAMQAAGIPVIQSWNETFPMWQAHRDNGAGHECSHYCHPSAPQSWVVAFYRALQQQGSWG